jgi:hypothetical protein
MMCIHLLCLAVISQDCCVRLSHVWVKSLLRFSNFANCLALSSAVILAYSHLGFSRNMLKLKNKAHHTETCSA